MWATDTEYLEHFRATTFATTDEADMAANPTVSCWVCDAEYPASRGVYDQDGNLTGTTCGCDSDDNARAGHAWED